MTLRPAISVGLLLACLFGSSPLPASEASDLSWARNLCRTKTFDARELREGGKYPAAGRPRILAGSATDALIPYSACLSLIPGQERACEAVPAFEGVSAEAAPARRCRELAAYARSAAGVLLPPGNAIPACRAYLDVIGLEVGPAAGDGPCDSWTRAMKDGNVKAFCQRGAALGLNGPGEQVSCPEMFAAFAGDPSRCPAKNIVYCAESAAMIKGLRSGRKEECRAAPLCEALTAPRLEACGPYLERANAGICAWLAKIGAGEDEARRAATPMPPTESDKAAVKAILQKEKEKVDAFRKIRAGMDIEKAREIEAEKFKAAEARRQERERAKALEKQFKPGEAMNKGPVKPHPENQEPRRKQ